MPRRKKKPEEKFINGEINSWKAGGYGCTVEIWADNGDLRIRWTKPQRHQEWWSYDTRANRKDLVAVAQEVAQQIRDGAPSPRSRAHQQESEPLTVREVWGRYFKTRWPGLPDRYIDKGASMEEIRQFYRKMHPKARKAAREFDSLVIALQSLRRLAATRWFALDRKIADIETGHWQEYKLHQLTTTSPATGEPYSLNTIHTDFGRFRTAIRDFKRNWKKEWGGLADPCEGVELEKPDPKAVPEIGEERALRVIEVLRSKLPGSWRGWGAATIAFESGRRIGAIGADRRGMGGEVLCAADFVRSENGRLLVDWRAAAAKGDAFGRGDEILPATRALEEVYNWIVTNRPNPLGPEYPLIWSPKDPTKPVSYTALNSAFRRAWAKAFPDDPRPQGLSFHAFCRTVITTIADRLGTSVAAEFTGRDEETVRRVYKRRRDATQQKTADLLDEVRGRVEDVE